MPGPTHFLDSDQEIAIRLKPAEGRSAEALAEAQALVDEPFARSDGIERRATTLQGAVAIAGSFALAGGALLLDMGKLPSHTWRVALVVPYAVTIVSLLACGLRALASARSLVVMDDVVEGEHIDLATVQLREPPTARDLSRCRATLDC